jgi:HK97 family phage prohead protease
MSTDSKTLTGYAAVFNSPSQDMGGWYEIIAPGAFTQSLQARFDVCCLRDHDSAILLGRNTSGTLRLLQDDIGLKFSCALPDTSQARDLAVLVQRGDIAKCSFGFVCTKDDWDEDASGNLVRTVRSAILFDVSAVWEPAYSGTSVSLRSLNEQQQHNRKHMLAVLANHRR